MRLLLKFGLPSFGANQRFLVQRETSFQMKMQNVLGVAVLILTIALACQMVPESNANASVQNEEEAVAVSAVEYARLQVEGPDSVTWLIGDTNLIRTESIRQTYRRFGGRGLGNFSDLLNQIGANGWRLVQKDGKVWIFTRKAS